MKTFEENLSHYNCYAQKFEIEKMFALSNK